MPRSLERCIYCGQPSNSREHINGDVSQSGSHAGLEAPEVLTKDTFPAQEGYRIFTGIGPDLMEAAKAATRRCLGPLARAQGITELEAYSLLGVVGELRIHEIVDIPHWVGGCMLPRRLF